VTIVEQGSRGRIVPAAPDTLPARDRTLTAYAEPDRDGHGGTINLEELIGPATHVAEISGPVSAIGRDVLRVGSFEHELVGSRYERASGWNVNNFTQHLTGERPKDGDRALQICRDVSMATTSDLDSAGRHRLAEGRTYSLCGCLRGHEMSRARASVVYWNSIARDATPIAVTPIVDQTPPREWECFCMETKPPPDATYVNVRLAASDDSRGSGCSGPDEGLHCVDWDALRLIEWQPWDGHRLTLPNQIDFLRTREPGSVSVTLRTLELDGAGAPGKPLGAGGKS
jgi:hypothetical protein